LAWLIEFDPRAFKELKKLDKVAQKRILSYLKQQVSIQDDPRIFGKSLTGDKRGLWRYRVGDYRIICQLLDEKITVLVVKIGHRKSIYD
jgi:mRNA interferase RelE/StbE